MVRYVVIRFRGFDLVRISEDREAMARLEKSLGKEGIPFESGWVANVETLAGIPRISKALGGTI